MYHHNIQMKHERNYLIKITNLLKNLMKQDMDKIKIMDAFCYVM